VSLPTPATWFLSSCKALHISYLANTTVRRPLVSPAAAIRETCVKERQTSEPCIYLTAILYSSRTTI